MSAVANAADPRQVKDAKRREKLTRDAELNDLRFVLSDGRGRRLIWRLLSHCAVFKTIWHPSALIHYNSGKQDVGHFLLAEVTEANPEAFVQMMQEAKEREAQDTPAPAREPEGGNEDG